MLVELLQAILLIAIDRIESLKSCEIVLWLRLERSLLERDRDLSRLQLADYHVLLSIFDRVISVWFFSLRQETVICS